MSPFSHLEDVIIGMMVEFQSEERSPISLSHFTTLGDSVLVGCGVTMTDHVIVFPQLTIPSSVTLNGKDEIDETLEAINNQQLRLALG